MYCPALDALSSVAHLKAIIGLLTTISSLLTFLIVFIVSTLVIFRIIPTLRSFLLALRNHRYADIEMSDVLR